MLMELFPTNGEIGHRLVLFAHFYNRGIGIGSSLMDIKQSWCYALVSLEAGDIGIEERLEYISRPFFSRSKQLGDVFWYFRLTASLIVHDAQYVVPAIHAVGLTSHVQCQLSVRCVQRYGTEYGPLHSYHLERGILQVIANQLPEIAGYDPVVDKLCAVVLW